MRTRRNAHNPKESETSDEGGAFVGVWLGTRKRKKTAKAMDSEEEGKSQKDEERGQGGEQEQGGYMSCESEEDTCVWRQMSLERKRRDTRLNRRARRMHGWCEEGCYPAQIFRPISIRFLPTLPSASLRFVLRQRNVPTPCSNAEGQNSEGDGCHGYWGGYKGC